MIRLLARHWQQSQPDLVVSMIPNFNHAILAGIRQADVMPARAETPMVTILPTWPIVRRISGSNVNRSTWFAVQLPRLTSDRDGTCTTPRLSYLRHDRSS